MNPFQPATGTGLCVLLRLQGHATLHLEPRRDGNHRDCILPDINPTLRTYESPDPNGLRHLKDLSWAILLLVPGSHHLDDPADIFFRWICLIAEAVFSIWLSTHAPNRTK